jgi:type I restriction enzyme S subunit
MNLETFFEKFELFADAPDAVAKMRKLVLLLSVRGKLSEQFTSESCVSQLAEAKAYAERKRKSFEVEPLACPFSTPRNWAWVALGHSMNLVNGTAFKPEDWTPEGTPIVRIQNLNNENAAFNRYNGEIEPKFYIRSGDFLISWSGTPGTSFGAFIWNRGLAILNQHIFRCELVGGVFLKEYLRLAVNARLDEMISRAHGGAGLRHITKGNLESIPLPLPPLAEQKRIVAKVDELMALCDRLEAQQQERERRHAALARASLDRFAAAPTPANLNFIFHKSYDVTPADLRKTILTLAVQGKLVPQDAKDESAEYLIAKIRYDHDGPKDGKKTGPFQLVEDENPHEVPSSWCWSCVQDVAQPNESVTYGILKPVWVEFGVPTVRVTEMKTGSIKVGELLNCDPQRAAKFSKTTLKEGDLLISKDGTIGKTAFVPRELTGGNITQHVLRFAISKRLDRNFIRLCIDAPPCQAWMVGETKGVALQGVNVADFRRMPLPIPPFPEQRRIVAKVDQLMALVDRLESQLVACRTAAQNLLSALLTEITSV